MSDRTNAGILALTLGLLALFIAKVITPGIFVFTSVQQIPEIFITIWFFVTVGHLYLMIYNSQVKLSGLSMIMIIVTVIAIRFTPATAILPASPIASLITGILVGSTFVTWLIVILADHLNMIPAEKPKPK